jgi:hypothetical protein
VNGVGNTIDSSGVLIAGSTPGNYQVNASRDSISGTALVQLVQCSVNTKYEAESFSGRHSAPVLETCTDIGGGQNFTGLAPGHYFAYNTLNVPSAGLYRISLRVMSNAPSQVRIGHSSFTYGIIQIPSTNGEWMTVTDTITLPALSYTGIHVISGSFKFNYFQIDNCSQSGTQGNSARLMAVTSVDRSAVSTELLYPNPSSGQLTILPGSNGYRTVRILDGSGQFVERWFLSPGNARTVKDIRTWRSGVYLLIFEGKNGHRQTFKLIKQ